MDRAGALLAFERGDARMRALVRQALDSSLRLVIAAGVLGQVWRASARQAPLRALMRSNPDPHGLAIGGVQRVTEL